MATESVLARIADNPKLPTPPTVTMRVMEHASRPDCTIQEIGKLISHDPGLCGKILKLVNSTLFGLGRPVTSIDRALNLLGLNHVRSLVIGLALPSMRFRHASNAQMKRYWKSSVTSAIVCRELAVQLNLADPDSEMVAGLLCDLGMMLLMEAFPEKYASIFDRTVTEFIADVCQVEESALETNHAEVGAYFLQRWKLSDEVTEAIRLHHSPSQAAPNIAGRAYMLYFADRIAQLQFASNASPVLAELVTVAHARFGLSEDRLIAFLESLHVKIGEFATLIDVDLGATESFAALFARATENLTNLAMAASLDNLRVQEEKGVVEQGLREAKEALKRTEQQLRDAQRLEAIGRLAGGIAHDFNNLLTVIVGNCELILDNDSIDDDARGMVDTIMQTGNHAAHLIKQLLAFGKQQKLKPKVVNLNATINGLLRILRRLAGESVQIATRMGEQLDPILIDPSQLEQVLLNLVVNARDAMPAGGQITMESFNFQVDADVAAINPAMHVGHYVVLAVRDTGCGMNEDTMRKIFEPFFTTKEKGRGTGLGLATVHGIVQQSGGHITVSSSVGHGTVFHIYLPSHLPTQQGAPAPEPMAKPGNANANATILLAEGHDEFRLRTRQYLESLGYKVLEAGTAPLAIEIIMRQGATIDLIVADEALNSSFAGGLARKLEQHRADAKILVTSGDHHTVATAAALQSSGSIVLRKPFTDSLLASRIRALLNPSRENIVARKIESARSLP